MLISGAPTIEASQVPPDLAYVRCAGLLGQPVSREIGAEANTREVAEVLNQ